MLLVVAARVSMTAEEAVRLLSSGTGVKYRLVRRLAGGETGAHEVRSADGRRLVMKWDLGESSKVARRRAVGLTDRLRDEAGWPVPRQTAVEVGACLFVLQQFMTGLPVEVLTEPLVDQLLELHQARLGLERLGDGSQWPAELVQTLTDGGVGYCLHAPLRDYDSRTANLVGRIEAIGRGIGDRSLAGGDIVHWDLHRGNVLVHDGRVAGVIDNDFVTTGDASFDLVTLAVTALNSPCQNGVRERLLTTARREVDQPRWHAYVAHLLLRLVDWSIRGDRIEDIGFWLNRPPHPT